MFDCARADDRHIKTKVLIGFAHFNNDRAILGDFSTAQNRAVCPFHRFNSHNRFFFYDNRLADINGAHRFGDIFTADQHALYLFLFACREPDVETTLDRLFKIDTADLFSSHTTQAKSDLIRKTLSHLAAEVERLETPDYSDLIAEQNNAVVGKVEASWAAVAASAPAVGGVTNEEVVHRESAPIDADISMMREMPVLGVRLAIPSPLPVRGNPQITPL